MTVAVYVSSALLAVGVALALFACIGAFSVRGPLARLHFVSLAASLGGAFVVAAIVVEHGASKSSAKALLVLLVLLVTGGVLGHATARAHYVRERRIAGDGGRDERAEGDAP